MSALGQKQTFAVQKGMSALPPKADILDFMQPPDLSASDHRPVPVNYLHVSILATFANSH